MKMNNKKITKKLYSSIMERCNENATGRIIVPTDILNRYIKQTMQENEDRFLVECEIIDIARDDSYNAINKYTND